MLLLSAIPIKACCISAQVAPEEVVAKDPTSTPKFKHFLATADDNELYCVLSVIRHNKLDDYQIGKYKKWALKIENAINVGLRNRNPTFKKVDTRMSVSLAPLIPAAVTQTSSPQPSPITALSDGRSSVSDIKLPAGQQVVSPVVNLRTITVKGRNTTE